MCKLLSTHISVKQVLAQTPEIPHNTMVFLQRERGVDTHSLHIRLYIKHILIQPYV